MADRGAQYAAAIEGAARGDGLDPEALLRFLAGDINGRLTDVEGKALEIEAIEGTILETVLAYNQARLADAFDRLRVTTDVGLLFEATSSTEATVAIGELTLIVAEPDRARFTPAGFLGVMRSGDPSICMAGPRIGYDRPSGTLRVMVDRVSGSGTHSDWVIVAVSATDYAAAAGAAAAAAAVAGTRKVEAEAARDAAEGFADTATLHGLAASTAQSAAEAARDAAEVAETAAEAAQAGAEGARTAAEAARDAALGHRDTASAHETSAETAKTAAETARTGAEAARDAADAYRTTATTKASEASASAGSAATAATNAAGSATAAAGSATAAAGSATTAGAHLAGVQAVAIRYCAPGTSNPATRPDGSALQNGDLYWNTAAGEMRVFQGGAWTTAYNPAGSEVVSFNGRAGAVSPAAGDYNAGQIANTPAGGIAATTVQAALNELDAEKAPLASPTLATPTFTSTMTLNAAAGNARQFFVTTGGSLRWTLYASSAAESGGNVGSDFFFSRHSDAGTLLDNPWWVKRSTGKISFRAPTTTDATINIGQVSSDPTALVNGDLWLNSSGLRWYQAGATKTAVDTTRTITAGTGLSGGGDLSTNRTLSFDATWGDARYSLAGHVHAASAVAFAPAGGLASTNVQAAIQEVKTVVDAKLAASAVSAFGAGLIDDIDAAAARATLGAAAASHPHAWSDIASGIPGTIAPLAAGTAAADKVWYYTGPAAGAFTTITAFARSILDDADGAAVLATIGAAAAGHGHGNATPAGAAGFMSGADKTKLDGVEAGANAYVHPTGDGSLHVPATGTTSGTKVLKAGATAGSFGWGQVLFGEVGSVPDTLAPLAAGTAAADRVWYYTGAAAGAFTTVTAFARSILDDADAGAVRTTIGAAAATHAHAAATVSADGFMSAADKTKLNGVADNANAYVHPTGDGSLHVPATGTANDGKVLKAGATAGSMAWAGLAIADIASLQTVLDGKQASNALLTSVSGLAVVSGDLVVGSAANAVARLAKGADGQLLGVAGGALAWVSNSSVAPDVLIEDQKSSGTEGGAAAGAAEATRILNTLVRNAATLASLASNRFTIPAGTYYVEWEAPAFRVERHQSRLYNYTDSAEVARGTSGHSSSGNDNAVSWSRGASVFTIAAAKAFEIRHYTNTARSSDGLGRCSSSGWGEVYTRVKIWKVS